MLKLMILLLLLANVAYYAWTQGALSKLGLAPAHQTEPERLQLQVHPELLLVTSAAPAPAPTETASAPAR
jgi:hypothetical protein